MKRLTATLLFLPSFAATSAFSQTISLKEQILGTTTVRLKVEQIQLVSGVEQIDLRGIGLQGA